MKKLRIKIIEQYTGGELFGYTLMLAHGNSSFSGLIINNSKEMREIAEALMNKANEIDRKRGNQ